MKLYIYDHCPYCVKARMIFGYKNQPLENVTLLNDDEATPIEMVGKKLVPILEKPGGTHMGESLDIINYIDELSSPQLVSREEDPVLMTWLKDAKSYFYPLAMPRWVAAGLEEFSTQGSIDYFTRKKEDYIGPFKKHLENTPALLKKANQHLLELEGILCPEDSNLKDNYYLGSQISYNDFHLFAGLRNLTIVKGINFPHKVRQYLEKQSELSGVPLHFDIAL